MLYGTLAETGDLLYVGLREGYRHTSYGTKAVLPGTIRRVTRQLRGLRMRADSGYYSEALVNICEQREVEYFRRRQAKQRTRRHPDIPVRPPANVDFGI